MRGCWLDDNALFRLELSKGSGMLWLLPALAFQVLFVIYELSSQAQYLFDSDYCYYEKCCRT